MGAKEERGLEGQFYLVRRLAHDHTVQLAMLDEMVFEKYGIHYTDYVTGGIVECLEDGRGELDYAGFVAEILQCAKVKK